MGKCEKWKAIVSKTKKNEMLVPLHISLFDAYFLVEVKLCFVTWLSKYNIFLHSKESIFGE
jgi:hypothetical protein